MVKEVGFSSLALSYPFVSYFGEDNCEVINPDIESKYNDYKLIIFTGGDDINPEIYGQKNLYSYYSTYRDKIEIKVLQNALKYSIKILGVCRGHQLVNAFLGGELVQDIRSQLNKSHSGGHDLSWVTGKSVVKNFFSNGVNSLHHQGVIKVPKGLIPTSYYGGVFESCESEDIITVQFHPEFMNDSKDFFTYIKKWSGIKGE